MDGVKLVQAVFVQLTKDQPRNTLKEGLRKVMVEMKKNENKESIKVYFLHLDLIPM